MAIEAKVVTGHMRMTAIGIVRGSGDRRRWSAAMSGDGDVTSASPIS
jgi:hypothetical protein